MSIHTPFAGEPPLHEPRGGGCAAAAWALTVLALGAFAHVSTGSAVAAPLAAPAPRSDSLLVEVDPAASTSERAEVRRALGADGVRRLVSDWRAYELPGEVTLAQARRLLAGEPAVLSVHLDARLRALETPDDTYFSSQWAPPVVHAPEGWDVSGSAAPVVVAVIDTGVQTAHPDLAGRLWQNPGEVAGNGVDDDANGRVNDVSGWNFYDDTNVLFNPADGDSHGTHVAGTIAARRGNATGIAGIADNARIMPLKFLKPDGGYTSDAITAIEYAVAEGATIINASWGGEVYSQPLCDAIALAGDAGVLFVVAAGNGGADGSGDDNDTGPSWPSNCPAPNVLSVAATTPADELAAFSNFGASSVNIGAPGANVLSTVPSLTYGYKSGTSMAAPHVAGVAAVVSGMHPGLVTAQLRAALMSGGQPAAALSGRTVSGRRIDLVGALAAAGTVFAPDTTPPDPFAVVSPADGFGTIAPSGPTFTWAPSSDGQSGITAYRLAVNGVVVASVGPGARSATPPALSEGVHTWTVTAVDGSGNTRTTAPRVLTIDRTAPSAPQVQPVGPGGRAAGPMVPLSWSAAHDAVTGVAGYRVVVDGVPVASVPAPGLTARVRMSPGVHTWRVVAVDGLGNEAASAERGLIVGGAAATPRRSRPLASRLLLSVPRRLAPGAAPRLRVTVPRAMRVTVSVRRAGRAAASARFRVTARRGASTIRFPAKVRRRMGSPGTYVVSAAGAARLRASVRVTIGPRR